ncbi:MAG: hypothetical protein U0989_14315 [Azonexus sp.]|nr:hypothetical protein [Azonexus sp.]MDZ4315929.1 hypothetical protein [Azonexus sp.]
MASLLFNIPGIGIAAQAWRKKWLKISVDRSIRRQATNTGVFAAINLAINNSQAASPGKQQKIQIMKLRTAIQHQREISHLEQRGHQSTAKVSSPPLSTEAISAPIFSLPIRNARKNSISCPFAKKYCIARNRITANSVGNSLLLFCAHRQRRSDHKIEQCHGQN